MKYPNGKLNYLIKVKDGLMHGKFIKYNRDGNIVYQANFNKGKRDGDVKGYYDNKQLEYHCSFNNGELSPEFKVYFPDGNIKFIGTNDHISKVNIGTEYNNIGSVIGITEYTLNNNQFSGIVTLFYTYNNKEENQPKAIKPYNNGKYHGEVKRYYKNGQLEESENYKKGEKHGEAKYFYENGKLRIKINYVNGKQTGEEIRYFENENLKSKTLYKNDIKLEIPKFYIIFY